ncbi:MAG: metal-dependent transcriptional regulator [Planctomycetota bacterium]
MNKELATYPAPAVENYVKELYQLQQRRGPSELVPLGRLADRLGVTPGTATTMVKRFADDGLIDYTTRRGARLTPTGERAALAVLRRHRIIETFLVEVLGLDWSEVHDEAEVLEHAISDKVLAKIDALLDHPTADPHGSPIPPAPGQGPMRTVEMMPLTACTAGATYRIGRLIDTQPGFLQFAEKHRLTPGTELKVIGNDPIADTIRVRIGSAKSTALGAAAAGKVLVVAKED